MTKVTNLMRDLKASGTLENINRFRKYHGMRELVAKDRTCLKCDLLFFSKDVSNRLCDPCDRMSGNAIC